MAEQRQPHSRATTRSRLASGAAFRLMFERSADAILLLDTRTNRFVEYNKAALDMLHCQPEELLSLHPSTLSPPQQPDGRPSFEKANEMIAIALQRGSHRFDWTHRSPHRSDFPVEVLLTPINLGRRPLIVVVWRDMTERNNAEDALRLAQKLESVGILAGGIAHDFNNMLAGIVGNLSVAIELVVPGDPIKAMLEDAQLAAQRARGLTQQLLTFSRGGAPVRSVRDLAPVVRDAGGFAARGTNVRLDFALPTTLWPVFIDAGQIGQVVQNLVINACQAMPEGGVVRISCDNVELGTADGVAVARGRYVRLSVADQGTGIAARDLPRIFDPYFSTKPTGRGLGLAVTASIVKSHGGRIEVQSICEVGSTFQVFLPASDRPVEQAAPTGMPLSTGHGRILVVDDVELVARATERMLRTLGYEAEIAPDGAAGVVLYRSRLDEGRRFDAVILDLTIPGGMGGKATLARLLEFDPAVRAIASSGYAADATMAEPEKHGFRAVLPKPYTLADLAKALLRTLADTAVEAGDDPGVRDRKR